MRDFLANISDKFLEGVWWVQDRWKVVLSATAIILFIVLMVVAMNKSTDSETGVDFKQNTPEEMKYIKDKSKALKNVFSELAVVNTSGDKKYPVLEIALYNKQPFMESADLELNMFDYLQLLKLKYNDEKDGVKIRAVRVKLYDRQIVYENGLKPNGTYMYLLKNEEFKEDKSSDKYEDANKSQLDITWDYTVNYEGKVDYSKYQEVFDYQELKLDPSVEPLSDEEFAWFLKLDKYVALSGGVQGAGKLYLQWELGANTTKGGYLVVVNTFKAFVDRLTKLEAFDSYYSEEEIMLKRDLIITNPQFLLYVETDEIEENPFKARNKLLKINPDLFSDVLETWTEEFAEEYGENYDEANDPANPDLKKNQTKSQQEASDKKKSESKKIQEAINKKTGNAKKDEKDVSKKDK